MRPIGRAFEIQRLALDPAVGPQAAGQDRPGVARGSVGFPVAQVAEPRDHRRPFLGFRPARRVFGGHLVRLEPLEHKLPLAGIVGDGGHVFIAAEIEPGLVLLRAVTRMAIALEERLDVRGKPVFERVGG